MAGTRGDLRFRVKPTPGAARLLLGLVGRPSLETGRAQTARVCVNELEIGTLLLSEELTTYLIDLPADLLSGGVANVALEIDHAEAVFDDQHLIVDERLIGLAIGSIGILPRLEEEDEILNQPVDFALAEDLVFEGPSASQEDMDAEKN